MRRRLNRGRGVRAFMVDGDESAEPSPQATPADVLIIGAGPAGLTAGYLLSKAGKHVVVLDRDPAYVGGIARTVNHNGFLLDVGSHRFFSKSNEVNRLWDELLPGDMLTCSRQSRIYYCGKFYSYPLKAFEAFLNLGIAVSTACLASYVWARLTPIERPRSFHDWMRNQFGEKLFSIFFRTYTEKVWGCPVTTFRRTGRRNESKASTSPPPSATPSRAA
jgi:protoporphyrinogen oxidase